MKRLNQGIVKFFLSQHYTVITTVDANGYPHNSCKGIVEMNAKGQVYLLDLYKENTYKNLQGNPNISITGVDDHKFIGYSLKGTARIIKRKDLKLHTLKAWEDKITKRISHRLLKNLRGERGHPKHPEALLPKPEYLIEVNVKDVVDLTPHHIKHGKHKDA